MPEPHPLYAFGIKFLFAYAAIVFPVLLFVTAPYGRHARKGWGPNLPQKLAWVVMETPSAVCFVIAYCTGPFARNPIPLLLLFMYQVHYMNRSFVFPFLLRGQGKQMPVLTVVMAILFNVFNGSMNGYAIGHVGAHLDGAWTTDPRFLLGVALFVFGFTVNQQSDAILRRLRRPGESGYKIPYGGGFRWVSSPNYMGELIEWTGFALAAWTAAAWMFVLFTFANLVPRAVSHHRWYREEFPNYPPERKAIVPLVL